MEERAVFFALHLPARAAQPDWQQALRRSVRLYLALGEPGADTLHLEAHLRLLERTLHAYLLGFAVAPPAEAQAAAWAQLERAQAAWLGDEAAVYRLLAQEPPVLPAGWVRDLDTVRVVSALLAGPAGGVRHGAHA